MPVLFAAVVTVSASLGVFAAHRSAAADRRVHGTLGVQGWITTPNRSQFGTALGSGAFASGARAGGVSITIDPSHRYQRVIGFGAALTASSAELLTKLSPRRRTAALDALFAPGDGAGINVLRVVIGASDFAPRPYTYDDVRPGATDPRLTHFSIARDRASILPLLRRARKIDPHLVIVASPWSAPAWMKTSGSLDGGTLARADFAVYARYLVRFLRAYAAAGVPIDAISAQNEPGNAAGDYPTMTLDADQEATFIGDYLGPALDHAGLSRVKILGEDDNWSDARAAIELLHSAARSHLYGTAFHCYAGRPAAQTTVHDVDPGKAVWLTECSGGGWSPKFGANLAWDSANLLVGGLRNWAQTILFWNLILTRGGGPHDGGCCDCGGGLPAGPRGRVTRNVLFAEVALACSAVTPGAVRIGSPASVHGIRTVAFINPDGSRALILDSQTPAARVVNVADGAGDTFHVRVPSLATVSLRWGGDPRPGS